jgi:DNA primase
MIPKETIEEIRSRSNVVEVLSAYLPQLRRRGSTFKCNCPFHQEKTPSFTVNETRQIFHCFGCGAGGDVFRFVMDFEKVDFVTAVKILAERAGVEIREEDTPDRKGPSKDILYKIHAEAVAFFHHHLLKSAAAEEARRYLEERDLPEAVIRDFQLGFAPNEWSAFLEHAHKKGFNDEQLEASGLIVPSERNGKKSFYDRFRNRVLFPIRDIMGRVIGFSGRILNQAEKGAKYVNSPETALFRKNQVLFAFDRARKPIVEKRQAIVVEGQIDAIRCHQAGIENVVASQGTALTENHARLIKRYADEVVLVLDADAAGIKAALASSETFIAAELSVQVVTLPAGEDPDSLILKKGKAAFEGLLKEAKPALDFLIAHHSTQENMKSESGKMRVVQAVIELIRHCPSASRRDTLIRRAADLLDLSPQAIAYDLRHAMRRRTSASPTPSAEPPSIAPPPEHPLEEVALLELLVHHYPEAQPLICAYLPPTYLSDPLCRELLEHLLMDLPESLTENLHDFDAPTQQLIARIQVQESRAIDEETSPDELAEKYVLLFWKRQIEDDLAKLSSRADLTAEERYIERTRLLHIKKILETGAWEDARTAIEARLQALHPEDTDF